MNVFLTGDLIWVMYHTLPEFNPRVRKIPLEKGTATHSRILAWRILWTEEPGGL